jgi:protein-S-isoprenylcysteine O-methyltransferase Ste14
MTTLMAKAIWCAIVVGWFVIRYPHQRRSRRVAKVLRCDRSREAFLLGISATGLGVIPALYVFGGAFAFADYPFWPGQAWLGIAVGAGALWMFRRTHKDLGRNWSVTLEIREDHSLVTHGVYSRVRHPMYTAFWAWAAAQALLLPNWFAGVAGVVGFGVLFFLRVPHEERMMIQAFGDEYRRYMQQTWRVLPGVF